MSPGLLDGVRVLDMTNVLAGPYAAYQLALAGADVVKLETPDAGDLARQLGADPQLSAQGLGASFLAQNAGKRSITVNLKHPDGLAIFDRLVERSDVLLENFRPGVLERLGRSWPELHECNPRLVYCALSGFGATGPMRGRPAYDQIVQGLAGVMSITGSARTAPLRTGFPICDALGGMAAAFAITAALHRQRTTGTGSYLDVSMLDATLSAMGWVVSDLLIGGRTPRPMANENATAAPSGTFDTLDGRLNIAANKQEQFESLCRALDREELLDDVRFCTRERRKRHRHALRRQVEQTLRTRTAAEWDRRLADTGVPCALVLSVPEAVASDQVRHRGLVHHVPSPADGLAEVAVLGSAVRVDGAALAPVGAPPRLGEHTDAVLAELGLGPEDIVRLRKAGAV